MKQYRLVDNIFGWVAFIIAAFTYCSTIEPTASFWDCPEFITTAYKQEIGHPPGAPFFMLLGNFFTHFASDTTQVAKMVNTMSALLSAVCIMFLFWTITHGETTTAHSCGACSRTSSACYVVIFPNNPESIQALIFSASS